MCIALTLDHQLELSDIFFSLLNDEEICTVRPLALWLKPWVEVAPYVPLLHLYNTAPYWSGA